MWPDPFCFNNSLSLTSIENLDTLILNATTILLNLDSMTATMKNNFKMNYSEGQQTYSWNDYRASIAGLLSGYQQARLGLVQASWKGLTIPSYIR
jgi:hypothetical protein